MGGSIKDIFKRIRKIQILCHMVILGISLPGNASLFYSYLLRLASFDVIPMDYAFGRIFRWEFVEAKNLNFELAGYSSYHFIPNMGSVFLLYVVLPLVLAVLAGLYYSENEDVKKVYDKTK